MKLWKQFVAIGLATAVACVFSTEVIAEEAPKIPGAGSGSSSHENFVEGTLDKYDSVLNKLTIKGIDEDRMTLDAVPSLKAKDGSRRVPMATVKQGQKIRVSYIEKGKKKVAKDVEVVKDAEEHETAKKEKGDKGEKESATPKIPGADK